MTTDIVIWTLMCGGFIAAAVIVDRVLPAIGRAWADHHSGDRWGDTGDGDGPA